MRHLWSFLAGLVVAPVTWVLVTVGQDGSARTVERWVEVGAYNSANLIEPAVYLGVAAILLGLVGTLRVSPLGPLTAGALLTGAYVTMALAPFQVRNRVPDDWQVLGDPLPLLLPLENGTLLLIGVMLLMATFSVQRWRRWPRPAAADATPTVKEESQSLNDWPPADAKGDQQAADLTLGYPDQTPTDPLPRRAAGESSWTGPTGETPWSAPPRSTEHAGKTK